MAGDGGAPEEVKGELGTVVENFGKRGGKPNGVGDILQGGSAGSTSFWVGDVGDNSLYGLEPGEVSALGIHTDYRKAYSEASGWKLISPTFGDSNAGGQV